MDDYLDPFLSSSSSSPWEDAHLSQRLSWVDTAASQVNGLLSDPLGVYQDDSDLPISVIDSNNILGGATTCHSAVNMNDASSSIFIDGNLICGLNKLPQEDKQQQDIQKRLSVSSQNENEVSERSFSLQEVIESNRLSRSFGSELSSCTTTMPPTTLTESGSVESNDSGVSVFPLSVRDSHSISAVQELWPSSYPPAHSLFVGRGNLEDFGLQGEHIGNVANILGNTGTDYGELQQMESFPTILKDQGKLQSLYLPAVVSGKQIKLAESIGFQPHQQGAFAESVGLQGPQQLLQSGEENPIEHFTNHSSLNQSQPSLANTDGPNGIAKTRVRARRGQATDPHSIAERLRREKIAERMKNLQELVPNSSKTDKASMLDEIINYVKFLQLQVKVLSMSRLGAAGAVVPLITDIPPEESSSLLLGQEGYLQESQDGLALEQEVVKLMESNVTMAMQYLQNKGLCLMPVALAASISGRKGSSSAVPPDRRKPEPNLGVRSHCSEPAIWESGVRGGSSNCNGEAIKQEESKISTSNTRDLKSKA